MSVFQSPRASSQIRLRLESLEARDTPAVAINFGTQMIDQPASDSNQFGDRVTVWATQTTGFDTDIRAQLDFVNRQTGRVQTSVFQITRTPFSRESAPDVCIDDAGNFTVTYTRSSYFDRSVFITRYDRERRTFATASIVGPAFTDDYDSHIACTAAARGQFVVSFTRESLFGGRDVVARTYTVTPRGFRWDREIIVANSTAFNEYDSDVARVSNNAPAGRATFAIVYVREGFGQADVFANFFDAAARPVQVGLPIATSTNLLETNPTVSANQAGQFVFAWEQRSPLSTATDLRARLVNLANLAQPIVRDLEIVTNPFEVNTHPTIVWRDADRFAVAYRSQPLGSTAFRIDLVEATSANFFGGAIARQTQTVARGVQPTFRGLVGLPTLSIAPNDQYDVLFTLNVGFFYGYQLFLERV